MQDLRLGTGPRELAGQLGETLGTAQKGRQLSGLVGDARTLGLGVGDSPRSDVGGRRGRAIVSLGKLVGERRDLGLQELDLGLRLGELSAQPEQFGLVLRPGDLGLAEFVNGLGEPPLQFTPPGLELLQGGGRLLGLRLGPRRAFARPEELVLDSLARRADRHD